MGDQNGQQCVVPSHSGVSKVGTEVPRERVDVRQRTASAGKQDASTHAEEGEEHPEDVEEEKAKRVQAGYRKRRDLGTRRLIKNSGIGAFAGDQRPEHQSGVHAAESNASGKTAGGIVEEQPIFRGLNAIVG
mmetsp:Transcript_9524/g.23371  ORF Transcript_9524/g.23371 Transcript_9524/m.23371 type:complete len:132 (+) Transcript_9524:553-948(+)